MSALLPTALEIVISDLRVGKPAVLPTETVYGLAARADDPMAIDAIYRLKGRDDDKPLALCVTSISQAQRFADLPTLAIDMLERLWPGPLTVVAPAIPGAPLDRRMMATDGTLGLRCPDIFWAERLGDMPLALTSANRSGQGDSLSAKAAYDAFAPDAPIVLDHGDSPAGKPSTVIRFETGGVRLLREGAMSAEQFADFDIKWLS